MAETADPERRAWGVWLLAGAFVTFLLVMGSFLWNAAFTQSFPFIDLAFYRRAVATMASGQPLFDVLGYPPFAVILLVPFGALPDPVGNGLWTAATLLVCLGLAALLRLLAARSGRDDLAGSGAAGFVAGTAFAGTLLALSLPVASHLMCGQISVFVLALVFVDAVGVLPKRMQGTLVGLAAAIKLTPLFFVPYYLVSGQRRQALNAVGAFLVATAIGFAVLPSDSFMFWSHLGSTDRFGDLARADNLSLLGTLTGWVSDEGTLRWLWWGLGSALGVLALLQARRHHRLSQPVEAALVLGAATVALSPVSWPHHQIWLVLAAVWLIWSPRLRDRLLGLLMYLPYTIFYGTLLADSRDSVDRLLLMAAEVPALVPVLIGVFGLPRGQGSGPGLPHRGAKQRGGRGSAEGLTSGLTPGPGVPADQRAP